MAMSQPIILDRKLGLDIADHFGTGEVQDLFGVEVELEGRKIQTTRESVTKYWQLHNDGSLRVHKEGDQACEYVFGIPLNIEDTRNAILTLFQYLTNTPGVEVFDSYRTSIHVHVNCLSETTRTIVNFLTLAIIFDELFVSQNGDTRIGNNFCLRAKDAEGQIADLMNSVNKYGSLFNINQEHRYSSVNFGSLLKFGTVEFRSLECTTDFKRVMHWINTLQALKASSRRYENPKEIISNFSRRGPLGFMITHLGEQYGKYASVSGAHQMLQNGMRLAQDFAYCSDWTQPAKGEEKKTSGRLTPKKAAPFGNVNEYMNMLAQQNVIIQPPQHPQLNQWFFPNVPIQVVEAPQEEIHVDWIDDDDEDEGGLEDEG